MMWDTIFSSIWVIEGKINQAIAISNIGNLHDLLTVDETNKNNLFSTVLTFK